MISQMFLEIESKLSRELSNLSFGDKVYCVYNPLEYAIETHTDYVNKYCRSTKSVLFLGMNPGPYGMAQTGVPFGDVHFVKNWMKISGSVSKPAKEHPNKKIEGLNCSRSEVSGSRLWSLFEEISKIPEVFFKRCFVHNYCPLAFLSKTGKNVTPPQLPVGVRKMANDLCNSALFEVLRLLEVKSIVGIGKFAEQNANEVVKSFGMKDIRVFGIMHPSPINPAANKGWRDIAIRQLTESGVLPYLEPE